MFEVRSSADGRNVIEKCRFESDALLVAVKWVLDQGTAATVFATDEDPAVKLYDIRIAPKVGDAPAVIVTSVRA